MHDRAPPSPSVLWHAVCLFAAMVVPKLAHMRPSTRAEAGISGYLVDVFIATHVDALFALAFGLIGGALLRGIRTRPRFQKIIHRFWIFLGIILALYSMIDIFVFASLRAPLTYTLIYLAGDVGSMRSSIAACTSWMTLVVLVLGPVIYFLAARVIAQKWVAASFAKPQAAARHAMIVCAFVLVAVSQFAYGEVAYAQWWHHRPDRRIAENPQWALLFSCLREWTGANVQPFHGDFLADDLRDFDSPPAPAAIDLPRRPKNVIFCVLESVAVQHLSLYGSRFDTTPNLLREAKNAIVFDNVYSHDGISATSLSAMLLSQYPPINWKPATADHPDAPGVALPTVLKSHGYRTAFITSTDFAFAQMSRFLVGRGFDKIVDCRQMHFPRLFSWATEDRHMIDQLVDWIDEKPGEPFFAMTWTGQTHHPYALSPGQREIDFSKQAGDLPVSSDLNRYLNVLRETDAQIERLFDALRARHLDQDTLVVLVGDHGEAFGFPHLTFMHGQHLYEENIHVPCVLWCPGAFAKGRRSNTVGGHVDINPTILQVLNIDAPRIWTGRSLLDEARNPRTYFFAADHDYMLGVREENLKYIYNATTGEQKLFDLASDPREQNNVAFSQQLRANRLQQRIAAWVHHDGEQLVHSSLVP